MKPLILATALYAALSASAWAEKAAPPRGAAPVDRTQHCESVASLAEGLMLARQGGVSLSTVMGIAAGDPQLRGLVESMILVAWNEPRWSSAGAQSRSVSDFRDRMHLLCLGA
jgi:hypothetical protein